MSAEYNKMLLTKLETLIGMLNTSISKMETYALEPNADIERCAKIIENLKGTLNICEQARAKLKTKLLGVEEAPSVDDHTKFKSMPPISKEEIANIDFTELSKKISKLN